MRERLVVAHDFGEASGDGPRMGVRRGEEDRWKLDVRAHRARAQAIIAAATLFGATAAMSRVRRLSRLMVRRHHLCALVRHSITRVRQHHRGARRDDREREKRGEYTADGVHESTHYDRMNAGSGCARQEYWGETSDLVRNQRVRLDLDHHRRVDQRLDLEH